MNEELATNLKLHITAVFMYLNHRCRRGLAMLNPYRVVYLPENSCNHWADAAAREAFVRDVTFEGRMVSDVYDGLRLRAFSHLEISHSLEHKRVLLSSKLAVNINSSLPCFEVSDAA